MCACRCVLVGVTVCMFIIVGQTAEPIGIKLGTQIHLFPDSVYSDVKVKVKVKFKVNKKVQAFNPLWAQYNHRATDHYTAMR